MTRLIDADTLNCMVNCYEDLRDYFHGDDAILRDRREFKFWLERMKWHVLKCEELACELRNRPEQKTGKWIKTDSQQYFRKHYPTFTCSECGQRKDGKRWNYCPNCGADMREE